LATRSSATQSSLDYIGSTVGGSASVRRRLSGLSSRLTVVYLVIAASIQRQPSVRSAQVSGGVWRDIRPERSTVIASWLLV
jgi:hypothetical protein